jgi:hypothetical protein
MSLYILLLQVKIFFDNLNLKDGQLTKRIKIKIREIIIVQKMK